MNKSSIITALILALCISSTAMAQSETTELSGKCVYPDKPTIVNGRTATEAEMLASQKEMKAYLALGEAFLECLDKHENVEGATDELKARVVQIHNAVVDDMHAVAELFNAAIRAYNGKNK